MARFLSLREQNHRPPLDVGALERYLADHKHIDVPVGNERSTLVYHLKPGKITLATVNSPGKVWLETLGDETNRVKMGIRICLKEGRSFDEFIRGYGYEISDTVVLGPSPLPGDERFPLGHRGPKTSGLYEGTVSAYHINPEGVTLIYGRAQGILNVVLLGDTDDVVYQKIKDLLGYELKGIDFDPELATGPEHLNLLHDGFLPLHGPFSPKQE